MRASINLCGVREGCFLAKLNIIKICEKKLCSAIAIRHFPLEMHLAARKVKRHSESSNEVKYCNKYLAGTVTSNFI